MALIPQPPSAPSRPINPEAAKRKLSTGKWDKASLLSLVVQDTDRAETFENTKAFVLGWKAASTLYQSPYQERYWENTSIPRASVPFFTVATAVNSLTPQIIQGLFYEDPPFMAEERPGTTADTVRAIQDVLAYQLEDIDFREAIRLGVMNVLLFGTNIWKYGWERFNRKRRIVKRAQSEPSVEIPSSIPGMPPTVIEPEEGDEDDYVWEEIEEQVSRPTFEYIPNIRNVLVDPSLNTPDIRKAKYVVHRTFLTFDDLDKLRDRDGFEIPSQEEVLSWFLPPTEEPNIALSEQGRGPANYEARSEPQNTAVTIDPFQQPLEVLEYWNSEEVVYVLQRKKVIGYDDNVYGGIPFFSLNWWDVPECYWGLGIGRVVGSEQRVQQGITNQAMDQMALALNGVYTRKRGKSVPTQSIRISPGRVVDVDDKDDIGVLPRPAPVPEAIQYIGMSSQRVDLFAGLGESTTGTGGATAHSNLARTAAGASMIGAGAGSRISDFVEKLCTQVFIPFLYAMYEMDKLLLPIRTWRNILNKELASSYLLKGGSVEQILNARLIFSITAGAKMQERKQMAQSLPLLTQFLLNPELTNQLQVTQEKVNAKELAKMYTEVSGWRNFYDIIVPMTEEEAKRAAMNSPAAIAQVKGQVQQQNQAQGEQQKFQNRMQLLEQSNLEKATGEVLRQAVEESATPEAVTGEPGGHGFGSTE